jgi:calcium-dependent protein kinase
MVKFFSQLICGLGSLPKDRYAMDSSRESDSGSTPHYADRNIQDDYIFRELLGHPGTFGEARSAVCRLSKEDVAIKIVRKQKVLMKMLRNEEYILSQMKSDYIADLYAVYEDKKNLYFVLEKCGGGDLIDTIQRAGGRMSEKEAANMVRNVAEALKCIHDQGFAHCDVKPSNILCKGRQYKVIDFGVSQSVSCDVALHQEVGSPSYMAPEVINGCYGSACDLWSLGVVLFVALYGFNPFNPRALPSIAAQRKICEAVLHGFSPIEKPGYGAFFSQGIVVSDEAKDLIQSLLTYDASKRLNAVDVLNHPWLLGMEA